MRVAAAIALMAGSAAAFAPANTGRVSTAVAGAFDSEIGATDFGDRTVCWDPLNFVNNGDQARFDRLRSVEIKHGRVAMVAVIGNLAPQLGIVFPGYISTSEKVLFSKL